MEALAINGGPKTRTEPMTTSGARFDDTELKELKEALDQQTLFYWFGNKVKTFCRQFATMYGVKHCHMVTSGTAALHVATATAGIGPGDEVITSPITDQGTIIAILAQGGIPIFADVDPHTYNLAPESVANCITEKTKAIVAVHLAGNPADLDNILAVARQHNLKVIEDCAQSYLCWYKGRLAGTWGDLGCFSLKRLQTHQRRRRRDGHHKRRDPLQACRPLPRQRLRTGRFRPKAALPRAQLQAKRTPRRGSHRAAPQAHRHLCPTQRARRPVEQPTERRARNTCPQGPGWLQELLLVLPRPRGLKGVGACRAMNSYRAVAAEGVPVSGGLSWPDGL